MEWRGAVLRVGLMPAAGILVLPSAKLKTIAVGWREGSVGKPPGPMKR